MDKSIDEPIGSPSVVLDNASSSRTSKKNIRSRNTDESMVNPISFSTTVVNPASSRHPPRTPRSLKQHSSSSLGSKPKSQVSADPKQHRLTDPSLSQEPIGISIENPLESMGNQDISGGLGPQNLSTNGARLDSDLQASSTVHADNQDHIVHEKSYNYSKTKDSAEDMMESQEVRGMNSMDAFASVTADGDIKELMSQDAVLDVNLSTSDVFDGIAEERNLDPDTLNFVSRYIDFLTSRRKSSSGENGSLGPEELAGLRGQVEGTEESRNKIQEHSEIEGPTEFFESVTKPAENGVGEEETAKNNNGTVPKAVNPLLKYLAATNPNGTGLETGSLYRDMLGIRGFDSDLSSIQPEDLSSEALALLHEYVDKIAAEWSLDTDYSVSSAILKGGSVPSLFDFLRMKQNEKPRPLDPGGSAKLTFFSSTGCDPPSADDAKSVVKSREDPPMRSKDNFDKPKKLQDPEQDNPLALGSFAISGSGSGESEEMRLALVARWQKPSGDEFDSRSGSEPHLSKNFPLHSPTRQPPPTPEGRGIPRASAESHRRNSESSAADRLLKSEIFDRFFSKFGENSDDVPDKAALACAVRFVFPCVSNGDLTENETFQLKAEVVRMGLAQTATDLLFHMIEIFQLRDENIEQAPSDEFHYGTKLDQEDNLIERFLEAIVLSIEAQENDVEGSLAVDEVSVNSDDGHWWEVPSKLVSNVLDESALITKDEGGSVSARAVASEKVGGGNRQVVGDIGQALAGISARLEQYKRLKEQEELDRRSKTPQNIDDEIADFWQKQDKLRKLRISYSDDEDESTYSAELTTKCVASGSDNEISHVTFLNYDQMEAKWIAKCKMATWNRRTWTSKKPDSPTALCEPDPIDGVHASWNLSKVSRALSRRAYRELGGQWRMPFEQRTNQHEGFLGVNVNSLYEQSMVQAPYHYNDKHPWERRKVKQRFLHEPSIAFCRNWFGVLAETYGNPIIKMPVCQARSMPMPMRANGWTHEWFRSPKRVPLGTDLSDSFDSSEHSRSKLKSRFQEPSYESLSWEEDIPECGTLKNVFLKPGDRITRLTPDLTSSIRKSRWRKKYFGQGTFPYDDRNRID